MNCVVLYSSKTQNTKKLANAISEALNIDILDIATKPDVSKYELIFYGFWVDKGEIDDVAKSFLDSLNGKKLALFYTAGVEKESDYVNTMNEKFISFASSNNEVLGCFMSQGAISDEIIEVSKQLALQFPDDPRYAITPKREQRWKESKNHPNENDLKDIKEYAQKIRSKNE